MRSFLLLAAAVPFAQAVRIVQSNDDGWSEANIRTFFDVLNSAGHEVVLSGPAENQSGRGWYSSHEHYTHTDLYQDHPTNPRRLLIQTAAFMHPAQVEARPQVQMRQTLV